jgi:hypothetical protein
MDSAGGYSGTGEEGAGGIQLNPPNQATQKGLQETQAEVDEVLGIIRGNVQKVIERGEKLSELDNRADVLQQWAPQFAQRAVRLKRKYWWKNLKATIILGTIALLLFVILIVWAISSASRNEPASLVIHASTTQNPPSQ